METSSLVIRYDGYRYMVYRKDVGRNQEQHYDCIVKPPFPDATE